MEFVQGEKFKALADNEKIFYCHTHDVNHFFKNLPTKNNFILITHNSDGNVELTPKRKYDADFKLVPTNLKKWFAQNVCVDNELLVPIPLGFENSYICVNDKKIEKIININNQKKTIKNLIYLNVNINNNPTHRQKIYSLIESKSYVTTQKLKNGINFDGYLDNLYNHEFMVCPPGNGHDVHQPWEALHCKTIPILIKSINNKLYEELPVCFVENWEQLTDENFLLSELNRIKNSDFSLRKLDFNYWKNLILEESKKI